MPVEYIPAIITASVALIAAVLAQLLNNLLTVRRDKVSYYKSIHKELISKYLSSLLKNAYLYKRPFEETNLPFSSLQDTIIEMEKDLQHFNSTLQVNYSYYSVNRFLDGANRNVEMRLEFEIAFYFILYAKEVFKRAKIKTDDDFLTQLDHIANRYAYLAIGTEIQGYATTKDNLISLNQFFLNTLDDYPLDYYEDIIRDYYGYNGEALVTKVNSEIQRYLNGE